MDGIIITNWLDPPETRESQLVQGMESALSAVHRLWNEEQGQELLEYILLLSFVVLGAAILFFGAGGSVQGIWSTSNSQLSASGAKKGLH
jgi:Flp pilus assembly pilin Flp